MWLISDEYVPVLDVSTHVSIILDHLWEEEWSEKKLTDKVGGVSARYTDETVALLDTPSGIKGHWMTQLVSWTHHCDGRLIKYWSSNCCLAGTDSYLESLWLSIVPSYRCGLSPLGSVWHCRWWWWNEHTLTRWCSYHCCELIYQAHLLKVTCRC